MPRPRPAAAGCRAAWTVSAARGSSSSATSPAAGQPPGSSAISPIVNGMDNRANTTIRVKAPLRRSVDIATTSIRLGPSRLPGPAGTA